MSSFSYICITGVWLHLGSPPPPPHQAFTARVDEKLDVNAIVIGINKWKQNIFVQKRFKSDSSETLKGV